MLENFPGLSDRQYAVLCKVTHPFVRRVRKLVTVTSCESETRIGLDKKKRKLPKKRLSATTAQDSKAKADADHEDERPASKAEGDTAQSDSSDEHADSKADRETTQKKDQEAKNRAYFKRPPNEEKAKRAGNKTWRNVVAAGEKFRKDEQEIFWREVFAGLKGEGFCQAELNNLAINHAISSVFK